MKPHRRADLADADAINDAFAAFRPQRVVNLAAQAGVGYSLKSPKPTCEQPDGATEAASPSKRLGNHQENHA
jgi:GDP-D-mannose dehydratase